MPSPTESGADPPRFPFILVDVALEDAELLSSDLFDLGASGVEERDETTLAKNQAEGKVTLVASFATEELAREAMESLDPGLSPRLELVVGDAWRDAWKEHFRPFEVADGLVVRPPWEPYEARPGERVLELEPGRAFGTGLHETTQLVCSALTAHQGELRGATVLDVGTGSGILALAALMLGAKNALCTDNDPDVVGVVLENAERNGFADRVQVSTTPVGELAVRARVVVANIEARVLVPMAGALMDRVSSGGLLVLSGILEPQREEVMATYSPFALEGAPTRGEWVALVLRAPV